MYNQNATVDSSPSCLVFFMCQILLGKGKMVYLETNSHRSILVCSLHTLVLRGPE